MNYGLLTDSRGCPISVSVHPGNTADPTTLLPQVEKVKQRFDIDSLVLVGDRGMIGQKQIDKLKEIEDVDWITALKNVQIAKLMEDGTINISLFDQRNLFELSHPRFPGERLVVCRNPLVAGKRARTRGSLITATARELEKVKGMVATGRLNAKEKIGLRVEKVVNEYKVAKHFDLNIKQGHFDYWVV